jgi:hypothetical protein
MLPAVALSYTGQGSQVPGFFALNAGPKTGQLAFDGKGN